MKLDKTLTILTLIFIFFFLKAVYLKKKIILPYIKKKKIKKKKKKFLFFFYTDWCLICKQCKKLWLQLKNNYKKNIKFIEINGEKNKYLTEKIGIYSYPSFIYLNKNKLIKFNGKQEFIYLFNKLI